MTFVAYCNICSHAVGIGNVPAGTELCKCDPQFVPYSDAWGLFCRVVARAGRIKCANPSCPHTDFSGGGFYNAKRHALLCSSVCSAGLEESLKADTERAPPVFFPDVK